MADNSLKDVVSCGFLQTAFPDSDGCCPCRSHVDANAPADVDAHDGSNVDWGVNVGSAASMADLFGEPKLKRNSFRETAGMIHAKIAKK